jgi:hypothetical protein
MSFDLVDGVVWQELLNVLADHAFAETAHHEPTPTATISKPNATSPAAIPMTTVSPTRLQHAIGAGAELRDCDELVRGRDKRVLGQ